jgi:tetratricopeptide (TPR) repeat protein
MPSQATPAQTESGATIRGSIRVKGSQPIPFPRVRLLSASGSVVQEQFLDRTAAFSFTNVKPGNYALEAAADGYRPARETISVTGPGIQLVTVMMQTARAGRGEPVTGVVDARIPEQARKLWERAEKDLRANRPENARRHLLKAVSIYEGFTAALRLLAQLALDQGQLDEAELRLSRARELAADDPQVLVLQGALLNRRSKHGDAVRVLEKGLSIEPESWRGHFEMAQARFAMNQYEDALDYGMQALEAAEGACPQAHVLVANALMNLQRYEEAALHLVAFVEAMPKSSSAPAARSVLKKMKAAGVPVPEHN